MSFYLNRLFKEPTKKQQTKKQTKQQAKQIRQNKQTKLIIQSIKNNIVSFIIDFNDD